MPVLKVADDEAVSSDRAVAGGSLLDAIARDGARQMLAAALLAEVAAHVEECAGELYDDGHRLVVRNGFAEPHPEVRRRGSRYSQELGEGFARVALRARQAIRHPDPEAAVRSCFGTVFATSIIRVAYGPGFATAAPVDYDVFVADLAETAARYLLADTPG